MSGYASAADLALRMIGEKGRRVTYTRPGTGADPVTQAGTARASTYQLPTIAFPISASKAALVFGPGASNINKRRLDVSVALKGAAQRPQIGDRFTWGGVPLTIVTAPEELDPDGSGSPIYARFVAEQG